MTEESIETLSFKDLDQDSVTAWSRALGDPDWFLHRRLEALAALGKLERPTGREEAWRFTDPKRAGLDRNRILRTGAGSGVEGAHVLAAGHADAARRPDAHAGARPDAHADPGAHADPDPRTLRRRLSGEASRGRAGAQARGRVAIVAKAASARSRASAWSTIGAG